MSSLPTQTQGTTSSSSIQSPFPNPNIIPNHGSSVTVSSPPSLSSQFQALPLHHPSPGRLARATEDSSGSPEKVSGLGAANVDRSFSQHEGGSDSRSPSGGRGAGSAPSRARMSVPAAISRSEQTGNSRSGSTLGSNGHSSGRRVQMTNANHLLNFHYDPIVRSHSRLPPPRRQHKIKPYNKDLFLQANYKFVVLDAGNYAPEMMDPDKMLRWEDIICLRYSTPTPVQCPICLDDPLCPQITSCGHIFCFPCILQYLLMVKEDANGDCFKRCPLCFMMVSLKDLYTIYIENVHQYNVGETIELMLLTRAKDSFTPMEKNKQQTQKSSNGDSGQPFSKFIFTADAEIPIRKAMAELDGWLARADAGLVDDLEKLPYVSASMGQLEQRKKYWSEHCAFSKEISADHEDSCKGSQRLLSTSRSTDDHDLISVTQPIDAMNQIAPLENVMPEEADALESQDTILSSSYDETESETLQRSSNVIGNTNDKESYNFYQAIDGQHVILHPLNVKCLLHLYGSYSMLPNRISGRILQLETITQTEATRRRYRYLSHFSLTTTYQLCELDLSGILPPDALLPFMDEIKKREKQRKQLANRERKEKIKAEAATAAAIADAYSVPISISFGQCSRDNSPQFSLDDFEALGGSTVMSSSPPSFPDRTSFSNVTRLGFAAAHDSPALKNEEPNASDAKKGISDPTSLTGLRSSGATSFANAISREKSGHDLSSSKMNEVGKKGKKQSRVLLSTASGRRY